MYCAIEGDRVILHEDNGRVKRRYSICGQSQIVGAQVSGDNVIIQCNDGWTYLYNSDGRLLRRTKG